MCHMSREEPLTNSVLRLKGAAKLNKIGLAFRAERAKYNARFAFGGGNQAT